MKVISKFLAVLLIFSAFSAVCFADENENIEENPDSAQAISLDAEGSGNEQIYINNYDDYANIMDDSGTDEESEEAFKEELKKYYDEYQDYLKDYYANYEREESNKARVLEAGKAKEEYQLNYQTYSVSQYVVQPIKVEVLDGEYSGEKLDIDYVLTADSFNNIILSEVKKGDIVFVSLTVGEDGVLSGSITNSWATVDRFNKVLLIGIIIALILIIYGGKKGFSTALVCALTLIFALFIVPHLSFNGNYTILVGIFEMICLIATISFIHLGTHKSTFKAILISCILTVIAFLFILLFNHLTRTVGVSFEYAAIAENIVLKNINFVHLYYITTLIIASVFVTNTTCMAVKKIDRESAQEYEERTRLAKDALPANIIPLFVTCLALYLPNHLLLLSNKFTETEILNAETLISELIRLLVVALCCVIVVPVVSLDKFGFGKKYLKEASESSTEETKA